LIASRGGRSGFLGVAPEAKILPVAAQNSPAYAKGIRFAADKGAQVINLSQAVPGPCPDDLQDSIVHALGKGAVVVAGAGNDATTGNSSMHPANCKGVLVAGAVDAELRPWVKTQRQPYVTVAAPGYLVGSVHPDGRVQTNLAGTSQASALTSGIIALVRSKFPNMSNREVVRQVIASAKDIGPRGRDQQTGYGFIRPYRIMQGSIPKNTPNPVFDEYDQVAKDAKPETDITPGTREWAQTDNSFSFIMFGIIGAVLLTVVLLVVFITRRRSRNTPPGPPGPVPGAPP
ncbi:S8 family serine peptidase, partial [Actinomadura adrarensis]